MSLRPRHALWLIPIALAAAGIGTWLTRTKGGPRVETVHAVVQPLVQTLVTSGRVVQRRQSLLGVTVQSTVSEVLVEAGDRVEADVLLVRLADEEAVAALAQAEAAVAEAEAGLSRNQGVGRRLASQSLERARIDAEQAESDYTRQQSLFQAGVVTEADLERGRRERDATRSRRVSASIDVAASGASGSDARALAAALSGAQARLRSAEVALQRTQLRAPSAGVVLVRHVERGEVVRPGDALITFAGDGPLEILVRPDESNLARLAVGQRALVSPDAFPDRRLNAEVARIAPSIDPSRGTVDVELTLEEEIDLRPEMTVTVEIQVGRAEEALVLPASLIRDLGSDSPWVLVAREGSAQRSDIELGLEGDELIQILSGLDADDAVIAPMANVEAGGPVRARTARPALD